MEVEAQAAPTPLKTIPLPLPMAAQLRRFMGPLSVCSYLISLPVLGVGIWLLMMNNYACEYLLKMPNLRVLIGVGMIAVFVISNLVIFYGSRILIPGFLLVMILLLIMLTVGVALVGKYSMESRAIPASPMWLRSRVRRSEYWGNIKSCLYYVRICDDLAFRTMKLTPYDFSMKKLSPIESGCCTPPALCGMQYVNSTYWNTTVGSDVQDGIGDPGTDPTQYTSIGDCHIWSNDRNLLCYDCETCKAGFLSTIEYRWSQIGTILIVLTAFLFAVHIINFVATMHGRHRT